MKTWILGLCAALFVAPLARAADEPPKAAPSQGNYVVIVGVGETADKTIQPRVTAEKDAKDPKAPGAPGRPSTNMSATYGAPDDLRPTTAKSGCGAPVKLPSATTSTAPYRST